MIQPVSEPPFPQPSPHNHLWLRILRMDRCHIIVSLLWAKFIHITSTHYSSCDSIITLMKSAGLMTLGV